MNYFAYGSNCNPSMMRRKGVAFTARVRASLRGYTLRFNKLALREALPPGIGFANIVEDPSGSVEGILYEIEDEHLDLLDRSERSPEHYLRVEVSVDTQAGSRSCFTYQAVPDKTADGLIPSRNYLNHILTAHDFLSRQYFEALDQSQVYAGECAACHQHAEVVFIRESDRLLMLCQACQEARMIWGDTRGRKFSVAETEAVMAHLKSCESKHRTVADLIRRTIELRIIDP